MATPPRHSRMEANCPRVREIRPCVSKLPRILGSLWFFFLARCCLGQVPGGAPFSQRSEQATACTNRMQIRN